MRISVRPHIVRFAPGYDSSAGRTQHQDNVEVGTVTEALTAVVPCATCGGDVNTALALVHRGRNLRGDTFQKVYHARHYLGGNGGD